MDGSGTETKQRPGHTTTRLVGAVVAAGVMWVLACIAVAVFLTAPMAGFDDERDPGRWSPLGVTALVVAIALFIGSGPVAYYIGGRRWLLALPAIGVAIWAIGIAVAYLT